MASGQSELTNPHASASEQWVGLPAYATDG